MLRLCGPGSPSSGKVGFCVPGNETYSPIKGVEFLNNLSMHLRIFLTMIFLLNGVSYSIIGLCKILLGELKGSIPKVCDDGELLKQTHFWKLSIAQDKIKPITPRHFGDGSLSPSSGVGPPRWSYYIHYTYVIINYRQLCNYWCSRTTGNLDSL